MFTAHLVIRPARVASIVLAVLLGGLAGCSNGGSSEAAATRPTDEINSFALALGVDPLDAAALDRLGRYDLVVIDGASSAEKVAALHRRGARVLGYLSVGTVEPYRPWYGQARREGWLLDRWPDWDEWYVDVRAAEFRDVMVAEGKRQVSKAGFDGLFLDNTDMVAEHQPQAKAMVTLVAALDKMLGPDHLLFAQNGDTTVGAIADHLDGWNREDVSFTYDFDRESYQPVSAADARSARKTLRQLAANGLIVTTTDYTKAGDRSAAAKAVQAACSAGALPFVSNIDLSRIPNQPARCR